MMAKTRLLFSTVSHLKPKQVLARVWKRLGGKIPLKRGYVPCPDIADASISNVGILPLLDFDSSFIARFDVDAILNNRVTLLHHSEEIDWGDSWRAGLSTPLWQFNLHYCEYLLPLANAYLESKDARYLEKGKYIIESWIQNCPQEKNSTPWNPYTISLRIINWLAFYGELASYLEEDPAFLYKFNNSLAEQFIFLANNLEKDLLANHYLENLKALTILSCYFGDNKTLHIVLPKLLNQVKEQILPDGMHFELSPMYHKIVLEDLMRVEYALASYNADDNFVFDLRIQDMCDCLYSLERNACRTPLFNDSGDNVAKSTKALLACAEACFGIKPVFKQYLSDAGYVILERETDGGTIKAIFDGGKPGPFYAMGHAHCDTLSFECFINGVPWIVNGGTGCYQGDDRLAYKRTLSHTTVMANNEEQHECWAPFRIGRHGEGRIVENDIHHATGEFNSYNSRYKIKRTIILEPDKIVIRDESDTASKMTSAFIFPEKWINNKRGYDDALYSPEFGQTRPAGKALIEIEGSRVLKTEIPYPSIVHHNTQKDCCNAQQ